MLEDLKKRFNPRRTYQFGNTKVEVDGVFVRIDDDMLINDEYALISLEDLLQDPAIIRSARVSTGRDTAVVSEKAVGLIGSLYRDEHVTPFEGAVEFRFRCEAPIYMVHPIFQLFSSHNEWSGRYSEIDGPFATPDYILNNPRALQIFQEAEYDSKALYREWCTMGIAREQARFALLYRFYTKFWWTISLRHLLRVCSLEETTLAPPEFWHMRDNILLQIVKDWTPWTYDKFAEYKKCHQTKWAEIVLMPQIMEWIRKDHIENIGSVRLVNAMVNEKIMQLGVHTGPDPARGFGHSALTFEIISPIFVHRQWVRHRYGAWSEFPIDFDAIVHNQDFYIPKTFRKQVGKAMSYVYEGMLGGENERCRDDLSRLVIRSSKRYALLRDMGFAPQQAGVILPYVFRVPRLWTVNIEGLMNFFSLRCDNHAQWEIRQYANTIYQWFCERYPWSNKIFLEHLKYGSSPLFDEQVKK